MCMAASGLRDRAICHPKVGSNGFLVAAHLVAIALATGAPSVAGAAPVLNPATGNYYEFVPSSGIDWVAAKVEAESMVFSLGSTNYSGYLATITSAAENNFLPTLTGGDINNAWLGGSDSTSEGDWRWVAGPEGAENSGAGRPFWSGDASGSPVGGEYNNWRTVPPAQPDAASALEDYLEWAPLFWNDLENAGLSGRPEGYFVEFNTQVSEVPEPASTALLALFFSAILLVRRMLLATIAVSSFATPVGAVTVIYNFDDGTNQGWTNALTSLADPPTGYEASNRVDASAPAQSGSFRVLPQIPGGFSPTEDSHHDTLVFQSPEFILGLSGNISFYLSIGTGSAATPAANFATLPAASSSAGFIGIGLRRVSDGAYVLSVRRAFNSLGWDLFGFDNALLASNSLLGVPLRLDVIDYHEGGFGWVALDTVTIEDVVPVPEPAMAWLVATGLAGGGLLSRARRPRSS